MCLDNLLDALRRFCEAMDRLHEVEALSINSNNRRDLWGAIGNAYLVVNQHVRDASKEEQTRMQRYHRRMWERWLHFGDGIDFAVEVLKGRIPPCDR